MRIQTAMDVAELVRTGRRRRRMSQQDLATAAGVSRRWLIDLEAGKPRAELALVLSVMNALGTPLTADAPDTPTTADAGAPAEAVNLDDHLRRLAEPS